MSDVEKLWLENYNWEAKLNSFLCSKLGYNDGDSSCRIIRLANAKFPFRENTPLKYKNGARDLMSYFQVEHILISNLKCFLDLFPLKEERNFLTCRINLLFNSVEFFIDNKHKKIIPGCVDRFNESNSIWKSYMLEFMKSILYEFEMFCEECKELEYA